VKSSKQSSTLLKTAIITKQEREGVKLLTCFHFGCDTVAHSFFRNQLCLINQFKDKEPWSRSTIEAFSLA